MWRLLDYFLFCDTWKEQQRSDLDRCKHCSAIKNETEPYRVDLLHKRQISLILSQTELYRDILCFTTDKCEMTFNWSSNNFNTLCMWRSWCERWDTNIIHYLWGTFLKYYAVLCIWVHLYSLLNSLMEETVTVRLLAWPSQ